MKILHSRFRGNFSLQNWLEGKNSEVPIVQEPIGSGKRIE
jgi:hypothetical protein